MVVRHFFTVDVEEHFQVCAFDGAVSRGDWSTMPSRLHLSVPRLLEALGRHGATATFFVLGWVARHRPAIVREISHAGHEIASHGYGHERVWRLSRAQFREDLRCSKGLLEDLTGRTVLGYRAPSFSITPGSEWAFDVLLDEGYRYDSSLFPVRRRGYGYPGVPGVPHVIRRGGGELIEFPLATTTVAGARVPAAGGGYLRHFPFWVVRRAFRQAAEQSVPASFYVHPWEIDPDQPRLHVGPLTHVRHYRGLSRTMPRIERLLSEFEFTSYASVLDTLPRLATALAASEEAIS